jgi:hypothetical protein
LYISDGAQRAEARGEADGLRFLETGGRVAFTSSCTTFRKVRVAKMVKQPNVSRRKNIPMRLSDVIDVFRSTYLYLTLRLFAYRDFPTGIIIPVKKSL